MRAATFILNGFAALWAALGLHALHAPAWALALPVLLSVVIAALLWPAASAQVREPAEGRRIGRLVGWASAVQGIAILAGVNGLAWIGHPDLSLCWVALVVGLHFVPLARGIPYSGYAWTAAAMVALAAVCTLLPIGPRDVAVGCGAALTLWATALGFLQGRAAEAPVVTATAGQGRA